MPLICENCKQEIQRLEEDDFGEEIDWTTRWEQLLCDVCHDAIWKSLLDNACPICETHPCERGRDCWVNPFPRIMYLCYVAPRKNENKKVQLKDTGISDATIKKMVITGVRLRAHQQREIMGLNNKYSYEEFKLNQNSASL